MTNTIPISFIWKSLEPTPLPYWKSVLEVKNLPEIVVELPLTAEYVYNFESIQVQALVANQKTEQPKLTPKGYKYCIDKLNDITYNEFADNNSEFTPN